MPLQLQCRITTAIARAGGQHLNAKLSTGLLRYPGHIPASPGVFRPLQGWQLQGRQGPITISASSEPLLDPGFRGSRLLPPDPSLLLLRPHPGLRSTEAMRLTAGFPGHRRAGCSWGPRVGMAGGKHLQPGLR